MISTGPILMHTHKRTNHPHKNLLGEKPYSYLDGEKRNIIAYLDHRLCIISLLMSEKSVYFLSVERDGFALGA